MYIARMLTSALQILTQMEKGECDDTKTMLASWKAKKMTAAKSDPYQASHSATGHNHWTAIRK